MFDNTKPNVILLADYTHTVFAQRLLGPHKIAHELRLAGFEVLVINFLHMFTIDQLIQVLKTAVSKHTVYIGVNSVFYRSIEQVETIANDSSPWEAGGRKFGGAVPGAFLPHGKALNLRIKETVKKLSPNCKFVLGGPDAQDREHNNDYDYIVMGQADVAAVSLANHLAFGVPLPNTQRSLYKFKIVTGDQPGEYNFVNSTMRYYQDDLIFPSEVLPIEMARGCIFNCKFCSYPLNGKKKNDYIKCDDSIYQEFIHNYENFGTTRYFFIDDTFNESKEKIYSIYNISKKLPFKLEYWAFSRLDLLAAHPDTIDLLYQSGCRASFFGIESMHHKTAKLIGKGGSRDTLINTIQLIKKKYGESVSLHGSFIFGLPEETVDSMRWTIEQLNSGKTGLDSWYGSPLRLMPSTGVAYSSDLDRNYAKYGYTLDGVDSTTNSFIWRNKFTDFYECRDLSERLHRESVASGGQKMLGMEAFYVSGVGCDFEETLNMPFIDFNWNNAERLKEKHFDKYLSMLYNHVGITQ